MNKNRRHLKNFLIYPEFQARLIFLMIGLCAITPVILFIVQQVSFQHLYQVGLDSQIPKSHPYFVFMEQFQSKFYQALAVSVVISIVLSIAAGLVISHRVSGPLVKMREFFIRVGKDPKSDQAITFRDSDFFRDLAASYNSRFKP